MQFSAITMILVAATAANALPEPLRFPGMPKPRPNKPNKPNKPNNGADSSWKWDAASLAISVADFGTTLSTTFAGNSDECEALKKGSGCWKGYCWSACNQEEPTWWAWMANTYEGQDWITCSSDSQCKPGEGHISYEGCGC